MNKISINIINHNGKTHTIETVVDSELSLMDVVRDAGFEMGNCGGMALCASCHCSLESSHNLNTKSNEEEDMLDQLHNSDFKSRLICQIPVKKELDGIVLKIINY